MPTGPGPRYVLFEQYILRPLAQSPQCLFFLYTLYCLALSLPKQIYTEASIVTIDEPPKEICAVQLRARDPYAWACKVQPHAKK